MPPTPKIKKEAAIKAALDIVKNHGIDQLNARSIAKSLGCSTKPLFRLYQNMEDLKSDIYTKIDKIYDSFITERLDKDHMLFSQSVAFVQFAREEKNLFQAMFLSHTLDGKSLADVEQAEWNRETIRSVMLDKSVDSKTAGRIFIDMWLYSSGIAMQIATNDMKISDDEIKALLSGIYNKVTQ
jgi:AcrR family transcriptional regulator